MSEVKIIEIIDRIPHRKTIDLVFPFSRKYTNSLGTVYENVITPEDCRQVVVRKDGTIACQKRTPNWRGTMDFITGKGAHLVDDQERAELREKVTAFINQNVISKSST